MPDDLAKALALVRSHEDYRLIERYDAEKFVAARPTIPEASRIGAFVDVETTGLDPDNDEIIEFAAVKFEFDEQGNVGRILEIVDTFQQPSEPLKPEIVAVTGLTDADLEGKALDLKAIDRIMADVKVVFAHNAAFDRRFCEHAFPWAETAWWCCTLQEIDWKALGAPAMALEVLAWKFGFFYIAHRADIDCLALCHLLSQKVPGEDITLLSTAVASSNVKSAIVWATGASFSTKDTLKARGYRWHDGSFGRPKCWHREVPGELVESEQRWLADNILGGDTGSLTWVNGTNRYSARVMS